MKESEKEEVIESLDDEPSESVDSNDEVIESEKDKVIQVSDGEEPESADSDDEVIDFVPEYKSKPDFISQMDILRILLSKETLYHVMVLFALLVLFGVISFTKSDMASKLIISLGYGVTFGYFFTASLSKFEGFKKLSRTRDFSSLIIPSLISTFFAVFVMLGLHHSVYEENVERFLSFGLIFIFIIWQFAQAWWMRIPFREFALRRMAGYSDDGTSQFGLLSNILSPVMWGIIGFLIFSFVAQNVSQFTDNFDTTFIIFWFVMILLMGFPAFYLLRQMHGDFWYNPKVASFSAYFSIGYWGFLAYHAGVLLYSMYNNPSFVFDLVFMVITIVLVIYSLSFQALRTEVRRQHLKDTNHYMGKAGYFISKDNVIFYAISFTAAYGASNFFLANADTSLIGGIQGVSRISHLIVIISGIIVILIVNYNLLTGRGLISEGFLESMRTPKDN